MTDGRGISEQLDARGKGLKKFKVEIEKCKTKEGLELECGSDNYRLLVNWLIGLVPASVAVLTTCRDSGRKTESRGLVAI